MNLSEHFTLEELVFSQTAARSNPPIDNRPDVDEAANLKTLCVVVLEPVRARMNGHSIFVTSGFRCDLLNIKVGGSETSDHLRGCAADIICPGFGTPKEVTDAIASSDIKFDQLIYEGTWVHISYSPHPRRQVLTATFISGKAQYSVGLA